MKTNLFGITLVTIISVLLFSCKSNEQIMLDKISQLEEEVSKDTVKLPKKDLVIELIDAYEAFAEAYPQHEKAPEFLFNAARFCMSYNMGQKAASLFGKIIEDYPTYERHPDSFFLKAFVYDSQLNNIPQARANYEAFIEKYPDHELADEAAHLINLLGKSIDEILAEFEKNQSEEGAPIEEIE